MSKVSWEGARLNKGKHGTAQGQSPGCCADLAHTYLHTLAAEWALSGHCRVQETAKTFRQAVCAD